MFSLSTADLGATEVNINFNNKPEDESFGIVELDLSSDLLVDNIEKSLVQWSEILALYVGKNSNVGSVVPSIVGSYEIKEGNLIFIPKFPLVPDQHYTAVFNVKAFKKYFNATQIFKQSRYLLTRYIKQPFIKARTKVIKVLPESNILPQNFFKFYLYFSNAMSFDNPYRYISIYDELGNKIPKFLVEFSAGLWDPSRTRLTVLIHPGRIKRGILFNLKYGMAFNEGKTYQLKVDRNIKDYRGVELQADMTKSFTISSPSYKKLQLERWQLNKPKVSSLQSLTIYTDHLIDPVLAKKMITIINSENDTEVEGEYIVDSINKQIKFSPSIHWREGSYQLLVDPALEDISGNNFKRTFDRDTLEQTIEEVQTVYSIFFTLFL
jgi:hypothetical protein